MRKFSIIMGAVVLGVLSNPINVASDSRTSDLVTPDGRAFLHREFIDRRFFNDWSGIKVSGNHSSQVFVHVSGEGKTVGFHGILSINCNSGSGYYWETAANYKRALTEADLNEIVPLSVIANAKHIFCK